MKYKTLKFKTLQQFIQWYKEIIVKFNAKLEKTFKIGQHQYYVISY
jgi:hypothetical protein